MQLGVTQEQAVCHSGGHLQRKDEQDETYGAVSKNRISVAEASTPYAQWIRYIQHTVRAGGEQGVSLPQNVGKCLGQNIS